MTGPILRLESHHTSFITGCSVLSLLSHPRRSCLTRLPSPIESVERRHRSQVFFRAPGIILIIIRRCGLIRSTTFLVLICFSSFCVWCFVAKQNLLFCLYVSLYRRIEYTYFSPWWWVSWFPKFWWVVLGFWIWWRDLVEFVVVVAWSRLAKLLVDAEKFAVIGKCISLSVIDGTNSYWWLLPPVLAALDASCWSHPKIKEPYGKSAIFLFEKTMASLVLDLSVCSDISVLDLKGIE